MYQHGLLNPWQGPLPNPLNLCLLSKDIFPDALRIKVGQFMNSAGKSQGQPILRFLLWTSLTQNNLEKESYGMAMLPFTRQ